MSTLADAFATAVRHHQANRLDEAEALYRQILSVQPAHAETLYLLGRIEIARDRHAQAETLLRAAIAAEPREPAYYEHLGEALRGLGRLNDAIDAFREAVRLNPEYGLARNNLALALDAAGDAAAAEAEFRQAIKSSPEFFPAHNNLGVLLRRLGRSAEARECFASALTASPDCFEARNNLAHAYRDELSWAQAAEHYRGAWQLRPDDVGANFNLAAALFKLGRLSEAAGHFERVIVLAPSLAAAQANLGFLYNELGQADRAVEASRRAIVLDPTLSEAFCNLALGLQSLGQLDEAIMAFDAALALRPDDAATASNRLYALNFQAEVDPERLFAEHRAWAQRFADPLAAHGSPLKNGRQPARRLRVGYVSAHFRAHAVTAFSEPILANHDHGQFEIFCYGNSPLRDATTERLISFADHWRDVAALDDASLDELIRADQIDILVDLTGHIGGNRLPVFARRVAPLQITYIGYQNTTGMQTMDYRLTDAWADPPGTTERLHTERLLRLPRAFFCYQPSRSAPTPSQLPARRNGYPTFGSFNNLGKLNAGVLDAWAEILRRLPKSRLVLLGFFEESLRQRIDRHFLRAGIAAERVELAARRPHDQYLQLIDRVDIALDPFPFNGHTTTCDALWQGVPVVMLAGKTYASRFGGSALVNLGLEDWIAQSPAEYVEIAVGHSQNLDKLEELRIGLRARMASSPLLDGPGFTRNLESEYRRLWTEWCAQREVA